MFKRWQAFSRHLTFLRHSTLISYRIDKLVRGIARTDPNGFVAHDKDETIVIDEIQKVPDVLDAIKMVVDKDPSAGQYLLTGSSNLRFAKKINSSKWQWNHHNIGNVSGISLEKALTIAMEIPVWTQSKCHFSQYHT